MRLCRRLFFFFVFAFVFFGCKCPSRELAKFNGAHANLLLDFLIDFVAICKLPFFDFSRHGRILEFSLKNFFKAVVFVVIA